MGKKGLSEDEKIAKIKEIFTETKDVLSLKEVEKIASKDKGLNTMLVKGLLQKAVDDNLVNADKIGAANFYWSFPGQEFQAKKSRVETLRKEIESLKRKSSDHTEKLKSLEAERGETEERKKKMAKLEDLRKENENLKKELQPYADIGLSMELQSAAKTNLEAANRWTDSGHLDANSNQQPEHACISPCPYLLRAGVDRPQLPQTPVWIQPPSPDPARVNDNHPLTSILSDNIFNIRSYCCNKFGMQQSDFNRSFELEDIDYIE